MQPLDRVRNLAQSIDLKKRSGEKFVLMLGAGASLSSGVIPTNAIIAELVNTYARQSGATASLEDRFDQLWRDGSKNDRLLWLKPYLDRPPSSGYQRLAELIKAGFFDIVITFNFDRLLERALDEIGFRDYKTIIRGETDLQSIATLIKSKQPRVKLLKMHGSLESADYFLFSKEEMLNYPVELRDLLGELTGRDIIICGYAFNDICVIRAFNESKDSGSISYVNPSGAGENIKGFLIARRSQERTISGEVGKFDQFVDALYRELTHPQAAPVVAGSRQNIFKFLDHYQEDQKAWFLGRRRLTRELLKRFDTTPPPSTLFLSGRPKVGKTSLIRAGFIPCLDPTRFECIYVRCKSDIEARLRAALAAKFPAADLPSNEALPLIKTLTPKRIVIFLDQFERVSRAVGESPNGHPSVVDLVNGFLSHADDRLAFVFVSVDETSIFKLMLKLKAQNKDPADIPPLTPERVASIIRHAARKGGVPLDPELVTALIDDYRQGLEHPDRRFFTLAHVQTICYYLVKGFTPKWEGYEQLPNQGLRAALDSIKEDSSLMDLLDDLPREERRMIRSFLKVICDPTNNTKLIVEFIRNHFPSIREDQFPEPLA